VEPALLLLRCAVLGEEFDVAGFGGMAIHCLRYAISETLQEYWAQGSAPVLPSIRAPLSQRSTSTLG
jgi:hypothetical protein